MRAQKLKPAAALILTGVALAACASGPNVRPGVLPSRNPTLPSTEPPPAFALSPARFEDLPGWTSADLAQALLAFRRTCAGRALRGADQPVAGNGQYGGTVGDWAPACGAADAVAPGGERQFFETYFTPYEVRGQGEARLTAYFEPIVEARRAPEPGFSEPLLRKPSDMVTVDVGAFADAYDDNTLRGAPRRLTGQLIGNTVEPYPKRSSITAQPGQAFAYANPVDVYNLQVQGSGRLSFPDGTQERAAFSAQNGYRWTSALAALRDSGQMPGGATWPNFKAWSATNGEAATHSALNTDPSYVFFSEESIADPSAGPRGAAGVNLTPMASLAVDPAYHPYGALIYVDGQYDNSPFDRLLVAQDTGGAIRRGPLRGDVFMGSGTAAGDSAQRMNAPARWWTLMPKGAPIS
jgi:membrane-bound lytic murein transglycosylase A